MADVFFCLSHVRIVLKREGTTGPISLAKREVPVEFGIPKIPFFGFQFLQIIAQAKFKNGIHCLQDFVVKEVFTQLYVIAHSGVVVNDLKQAEQFQLTG